MRLTFVLPLIASLGCARRDAAWTMRPDRAGDVRFGTKAADASAADSGCRYWRPEGAPPGVNVMIENGVIVRADVDSAGPKTEEGIGIGSTEAEIRAAYGQHLTVQLHKYQWDKGWRYFIYLPPTDSLNAIVFETDDKAVRTFRVGRRPQVQYVERCG
jgi:hypothetical protein